MQELKKKTKDKLQISCTAYTIAKSGTTSAQAYEVKIVDGKLASIKEISRAPDLPVSVIGRAVDFLWNAYRSQQASTLNAAVGKDE